MVMCHLLSFCLLATWHTHSVARALNCVIWHTLVLWQHGTCSGGRGRFFLFITQAGARRMRVRKSHSYPRRYFCMAVLSTSYFGLPKRVVDCTNFFMRQSRLSPWTVVKTAHKASFGEHGRNCHSSRDNCARARRSMSCEQFPQPRLVAPGPRWV